MQTTFRTIYLICHFALSLPYQLELKLTNNKYFDEEMTDYNLCQVFEPISENQNYSRLFTKAMPNTEISHHVRFIVLHKCQTPEDDENLFEPHFNQTYMCQDTRFVQVIFCDSFFFANNCSMTLEGFS